jgi:hypothetical protein
MLAPSLTAAATPVWPIPADSPNLQAIVWAGMKTIAQQEALLHAYQTDLNNVQAIAPATGTGTNTPSPGTTLVLTGVVGLITPGAVIAGAGVVATPPLTIVSQISGTTGGNGSYTISASAALSAVALTFTPGGGNPKWPVSTSSDDLMLIAQDQTAIIRSQTALLQQYQDLLNVSATAAPATGP